MNRPTCPSCLNLNHQLFQPGYEFAEGWSYVFQARYRAIDFAALRATSTAGCPVCNILTQGTDIFWGSCPEDGGGGAQTGPRPRRVLVLESHQGNALQVFRGSEPQPFSGITDHSSRIEFFTKTSDDPFRSLFGHARHVPTGLSSTTAGRMLKSWLQRCEETHASCNIITPVKLPKRVIDISSNVPKLVEFSVSEIPQGVYATVSHCWGEANKTSKPTLTTKATLESRKAGIAPEELSPLFSNIIELCRMVDCNYIWIDSLCIIQDDDSDWETESQKMAQIYSNAHFNVAATSARDSAHELFQERWSLRPEVPWDPYRNIRRPGMSYDLEVPSVPGGVVTVRLSHTRDHHYVQGERLLNGRISQAPLMERAWVLQEVLLARRSFHICASELVWECRTCYDCECGSIESDRPTTTFAETLRKDGGLDLLHRKREFTRILEGLRSTREIHDFWYRICEQYGNLQLTNHLDRRAALAGLVDAIRNITKGTCVAGMWMEDLPRSLLWTGAPIGGIESDLSRLPGIPSWSWMSRRHRGDNTCTPLYHTVLEKGFRQHPAASVQTPTILSGLVGGDQLLITYRGPTILAQVSKRPMDGWLGEYWRGALHIELGSYPEQLLDFDSSLLHADCPLSPEDPVREGDLLECLLLGTDEMHTLEYVLVVRRCNEKADHLYKRVGTAELKVAETDGSYLEYLVHTKSYFHGAEIKTFRII